jgi:hypothetical protein
MAFGVQFPLINGFYPSWSEINLDISGSALPITDFKGASWDESVEVGDVYGAGPLKQGTTRGVSKPGTVKLELYLDAADTLEESLALNSTDGQSVSFAQFGAILQWQKADFSYSQVQFIGCRVIKIGQDSKQGPEAEFRPFELNVTQIVRVSHGVARGLLLSAG